MKKIVLLFLGCSLLISCGDKKKESTEETNQPEVVLGNFSVIIDGTYKKNDTLVFYYSQNGFECTDEQALKLPITGSDKQQNIIVKLPSEVLLGNFRINLSNNPSQETVLLNSMKILRNAKSLDIKQVEFSKYLNFNENVSWDDKLKGFKFSTLNGNYIPRVLGNEFLESKLSEL